MKQKYTLKYILMGKVLFLSTSLSLDLMRAAEQPQLPQKPHTFTPISAKTGEQLLAKRLKLAVQSGDLREIMQNVNPQNINQLDSHGFTPLYYARTAPVAALLIYNGANTQASNNYGITPLHQAAALNDLEVVRLLVEPSRHSNIFIDNYELTRAINNYLARNAQRIAIPANVSDIQRGALTPLWYAVAHNAQQVAEYLLERINANSEMILPVLNEIEPGTLRSVAHIATTPAMIDLLARYNAPLNLEEYYQHTPLEAAAANNRENLVEALVANHALINGPVTNPRPADDPRRLKVIEALKRIYKEKNPLLYTVLIGDFDEAKKILESGQNTLVQGTGLSGMFGRLMRRQQTEAERLFNTPIGTLTPLRAAIGQQSRPLVALLITYGALANATNTQIRELEELARNVSSPEVTSLFVLLRGAANDEARREIAQRFVTNYARERTPTQDLETGEQPMTRGEEQQTGPTQEPVRLGYQQALQQIPLPLPTALSGFGGGSQRD